MSFARHFRGSELHEQEHVGPTPAARDHAPRRHSMKPEPSGSAAAPEPNRGPATGHPGRRGPWEAAGRSAWRRLSTWSSWGGKGSGPASPDAFSNPDSD